MDFDDVVIGSGLAAIAVVSGLPAHRRVLVLEGATDGGFLHYDASVTTPCAYVGSGGLGNHWHGVIPLWLQPSAASDTADYCTFLRRFYPSLDIESRIGGSWLFVPWRPIRPATEWQRLARRGLRRLPLSAERLLLRQDGIEVISGTQSWRAARAWLAAGALHSPGLLARSFGPQFARATISDHVICYLGQLRGVAPPPVQRSREGVCFAAREGTNALYTCKPARFAFSRLDHGIELRAVFGLPTGSLIAKLLRRCSPGLLAEAIYNRTGLGARADVYSVYAQVEVPEAYHLGKGLFPLQRNEEAIRDATRRAHEACPFSGLNPTRVPDLYLPGIHLHHSVDPEALTASGLHGPGAPLQVVDASSMTAIGPAHHSFRMMFRAWQLASRVEESPPSPNPYQPKATANT